jgi:hypothetical protein
MTEFLTAIAAGVAVSLWNKFLLNGGWRACLAPEVDGKDDEDLSTDSSTSSTISLEVHTHA